MKCLSFKENCPNLRNTRVVDIARDFKELLCEIDVYDPWVAENEALTEYGIAPVKQLKTTMKSNQYETIKKKLALTKRINELYSDIF